MGFRNISIAALIANNCAYFIEIDQRQLIYKFVESFNGKLLRYANGNEHQNMFELNSHLRALADLAGYKKVMNQACNLYLDTVECHHCDITARAWITVEKYKVYANFIFDVRYNYKLKEYSNYFHDKASCSFQVSLGKNDGNRIGEVDLGHSIARKFTLRQWIKKIQSFNKMRKLVFDDINNFSMLEGGNLFKLTRDV